MRRKVRGISFSEINAINERCGGTVFQSGYVKDAIQFGRNKGLYTRIAYLVRAIVSFHSYTDGNKRTAYMAAYTMLKRNGKRMTFNQNEELKKQIGKIARNRIDNMGTIRRMIEYAIEGY